MRELCAILRAVIFAAGVFLGAQAIGFYGFQATKYATQQSALSRMQLQVQMQAWIKSSQDEQLERLLRPRKGGVVR